MVLYIYTQGNYSAYITNQNNFLKTKVAVQIASDLSQIEAKNVRLHV